MSKPGNPGPPMTEAERSGTVLETDEEIRHALLSGLKGQQPVVAVEWR